jgi:hypothetical protein
MVIADDGYSTIAWGPSPTYGELCYGDSAAASGNKSSTTPKESKPLEGNFSELIKCFLKLNYF